LKEEDVFTYVQIDGEFYKAKNVDSITLQLSKESLQDGKLKILERNDPAKEGDN